MRSTDKKQFLEIDLRKTPAFFKIDTYLASRRVQLSRGSVRVNSVSHIGSLRTCLLNGIEGCCFNFASGENVGERLINGAGAIQVRM